MKPDSYTNAKETVMSYKVFQSLSIYNILSTIRKVKK